MLVAFIAAACGVTGCSEKRPHHPHVGLRVYMDGEQTATCGFFAPEILDAPPGLRIKLTNKSFSQSSGGHKVLIQWKPDLGGSTDHYNLIITADQVTSTRRIAYHGQPIVLMEQPFRVVVDDVGFGKSSVEKTGR